VPGVLAGELVALLLVELAQETAKATGDIIQRVEALQSDTGTATELRGFLDQFRLS
jgi:hypothetical protein